MKAVVLGSDFIKLPNGDIKLLEVNTNVGVLSQGTQFLDFSILENLIDTNGISEIHLIFNDTNFIGKYIGFTKDSNSFWSKIKQICENKNISFNEYLVDKTAVTVPYIEDTSNKLIIRIAYDTTAIIDSEYTSNKANFLNLLHEKSYIPKSYHSNIDDIGNQSFSYTGNEPNYIVKSNVNMDDRTVYPKLYRVENETQLNNIKNSIDSENYFIQEYLVSEEINNKLSIIRSIDLLYGSNLDVLHLGAYKVLNVFENDTNNLIDSDGLYSSKDRPKYITYTEKRFPLSTYIIDNETDVWMADGTKKLATELVIGDSIKTIYVPGLDLNEGIFHASLWSGSASDFANGYTIGTTTVEYIETNEEERIFKKITTESGKNWNDLPASEILVKDGSFIKFKYLEDIDIGDVIYIFDTQNQTLLEETVSNIELEWKKITIGQLDVEPNDLFLPFIDNESQFTIIQHNLCKAFCKQYLPCPNYQNPNCNTCSPVQCTNQK